MAGQAREEAARLQRIAAASPPVRTGEADEYEIVWSGGEGLSSYPKPA